MNDCDTRKQELDWKEIVKIVHACCKSSGNAYSTQLMKGGYYHDDGEFVLENVIQISLMGSNEETVDEIANKLCSLLNQESIIVCSEEVTSYYVLGK